jgi:serine/threonine protein kinase
LEPGSTAVPLDASNGDQQTLGFESSSPSRMLQGLARSIGSIHRVLLPDTRQDDRDVAVIRPSSDEIPPTSERNIRYQLFGEIARGGMGAVLKGHDPDLGRDLAVKVLLESHRNNPDLLRRFVEEAQIGGQLQHPGIVPVYELGAFADSRPFFTMKLVKGRTLAQILRERNSPADELPRLLGIFEQVCQTMAYAHSRGVIHRDLKPTNVMVGSFGEVQVMDWGLAKVLKAGGIADETTAAEEPAPRVSVIRTVRSGSDADDSQAGSILGTPAYMAPEQAGGDVEHLDRRSDVFGLGSILCEILTGRPAYTGRNYNELIRKAMRCDTGEALSRLDASGAESDLIALARECLALEAEDRPRDAGVVTDRVAGYLAGVQQRLRDAELARAQADARAQEERKRRKLSVALAAAVLALMAFGGLSSAYLLQQQQARLAVADRLLGEVTTLLAQARARPDDLVRWQEALAAVHQNDTTELPHEARQRLAALTRDIKAGNAAARADQELLARLVQLRSVGAESLENDWRRFDAPDGSIHDAAYKEAFREAGLDVDVLGPEAAAARIRSRPEQIALALAAALDDWAAQRRLVRRHDEVAWRRLVAAARLADPDPGEAQTFGAAWAATHARRSAWCRRLARRDVKLAGECPRRGGGRRCVRGLASSRRRTALGGRRAQLQPGSAATAGSTAPPRRGDPLFLSRSRPPPRDWPHAGPCAPGTPRHRRGHCRVPGPEPTAAGGRPASDLPGQCAPPGRRGRRHTQPGRRRSARGDPAESQRRPSPRRPRSSPGLSAAWKGNESHDGI